MCESMGITGLRWGRVLWKKHVQEGPGWSLNRESARAVNRESARALEQQRAITGARHMA